MKRFIVLAGFLTLALVASDRFVAAGEKANPILDEAKAKLSDPTKPFTLVVVLTVKEGKGKEFEAAMKPAITASRKEMGCMSYDLNRDLKEETKYYVYERWKSVAALETHMQTEHFKALVAVVHEIVTGPPELKFFAVAAE